MFYQGLYAGAQPTIGVAEGGSWGSEEPPLGGSNRARKRRPVLPVAHV